MCSVNTFSHERMWRHPTRGQTREFIPAGLETGKLVRISRTRLRMKRCYPSLAPEHPGEAVSPMVRPWFLLRQPKPMEFHDLKDIFGLAFKENELVAKYKQGTTKWTRREGVQGGTDICVPNAGAGKAESLRSLSGGEGARRKQPRTQTPGQHSSKKRVDTGVMGYMNGEEEMLWNQEAEDKSKLLTGRWTGRSLWESLIC